MKSQRIDSAPITGVTMKGSSEMKMTGPRIDRAALLTASAIASPVPSTSGSVSSVNISVKRSAA